MDEVRITGSPAVSSLVRRAVDQASPATTTVKSNPGTDSDQAQPSVEPGQVQEQAMQDRRQQVDSAVKQLNEYVQSTQRGLKFDYDEAASETVITVVDRSTNEVIRQIPDEVALELARSLSADSSSFSLLNVKA
jgi:flagellar protein FlaG